MSKERMMITQGLCDHVQILLKGGASMKKAGEMVGISQSTVSRIQAAEFSASLYEERNTERRVREQQKRKLEEKKAEVFEKLNEKFPDMKPAEGQVPGQMKMNLPEVKQYNPDSGKFEPYMVKDINTMMRFQAAMTDKILMKLDQLNDNLCQLLRAVRKE